VKTLIDVDDAALSEAQRILGTTTKKDTVNTALRRIAAEEQRRTALVAEMDRARSGFYRQVLDDEAAAWG